jgi:hypothetical protein
LAWERSTTLSLSSLFEQPEVHTSPREGPKWPRALVRRRVHFINCHGAEADPRFYGQRRSSYPVSLESALLSGQLARGTIVAAECCYGGQLWPAERGALPMPVAYVAAGAYGYFGSSTISYGPPDSNADADLICRYYVETVLAGASVGRAALEARQRFVKDVSVLSPVNTKTLSQFSLFGDPSIHPVKAPRRRSTTKLPTGRKNRRERLLEQAIANMRDTSVVRSEDTPAHDVPAVSDAVLADLPITTVGEPRVHTFRVSPPPLAPFLPPPPQAEVDANARIRVVLADAETNTGAIRDIVAVEAREQDGALVGRNLLRSK